MGRHMELLPVLFHIGRCRDKQVLPIGLSARWRATKVKVIRKRLIDVECPRSEQAWSFPFSAPGLSPGDENENGKHGSACVYRSRAGAVPLRFMAGAPGGHISSATMAVIGQKRTPPAFDLRAKFA